MRKGRREKGGKGGKEEGRREKAGAMLAHLQCMG